MLRVQHRAQEAGVPVPASAADRAARFIVEALARQDEKMGRDPLLEASRPLVALALAEQGYDVEPLIRQAFAQRTLLPVFAQAELLHALAVLRRARARGTKLRPQPRVAERTKPPLPQVAPSLPLDDLARALLRLVTGQVKVEGTHAFAVEPEWSGGQELLSSSDRTTAILLSALLATDPDHPLVDRLARYLVLGRKDAAGRPTARFGNTQEAAFGLLALWDHTRLRETRIPDLTATVWLARSRLLTQRLSGRSLATGRLHVPMADLLRSLDPARSRLTFQAQGTGRLYYSARLTSARQDPREPAASRGFEVRREVLVLDDRYRPLWERLTPRLGDVVQVLLTVRITEPRRRVVVDDPLPGGLEAIDSHVPSEYRPVNRLLTLQGKAVRTEFQHQELRHDRVLHFIDALPPGTHHFGYHARVTSPGTFVWPAARVEEMYAPEVYGTSAGTVMTTSR